MSPDLLAPTAAVVAGALVLGGIWRGFGETSGEILDCRAVATVEVVAEFSDYRCRMDFGEGDIKCRTERWTESASPVVRVVADNRWLALPAAPAPDPRWSGMVDFDGYAERRTCDLEVQAAGRIFSEPCAKNDFCVKRRAEGRVVKVKTWYGRPYSVEDWDG